MHKYFYLEVLKLKFNQSALKLRCALKQDNDLKQNFHEQCSLTVSEAFSLCFYVMILLYYVFIFIVCIYCCTWRLSYLSTK